MSRMQEKLAAAGVATVPATAVAAIAASTQAPHGNISTAPTRFPKVSSS